VVSTARQELAPMTALDEELATSSSASATKDSPGSTAL